MCNENPKEKSVETRQETAKTVDQSAETNKKNIQPVKRAKKSKKGRSPYFVRHNFWSSISYSKEPYGSFFCRGKYVFLFLLPL